MATTGPETHHAKLVFDLMQPAAQGRLTYVPRFRRLSQTAVLRAHERRTQITKLYVHAV